MGRQWRRLFRNEGGPLLQETRSVSDVIREVKSPLLESRTRPAVCRCAHIGPRVIVGHRAATLACIQLQMRTALAVAETLFGTLECRGEGSSDTGVLTVLPTTQRGHNGTTKVCWSLTSRGTIGASQAGAVERLGGTRVLSAVDRGQQQIRREGAALLPPPMTRPLHAGGAARLTGCRGVNGGGHHLNPSLFARRRHFLPTPLEKKKKNKTRHISHKDSSRSQPSRFLLNAR
ncbi:unnamed protein product, partial [Iphiclides podalirius]